MNNETRNLKEISVAELISRFKELPLEKTSLYVEEIIRRFEPLMRSIWSKSIPTDFYNEYEDFVQDVFVELFKSLNSIKIPAAFPGFIHAIAMGVIKRYWRKKSILVSEDSNLHETALVTLEEELLISIYVRTYINGLSVQEQEVLERSIIRKELSDEIAKDLGIEPGAVRMAKSRALKKLRDLILKEVNKLE